MSFDETIPDIPGEEMLYRLDITPDGEGGDHHSFDPVRALTVEAHLKIATTLKNDTEVALSFYKVAIKERDAERARALKLEGELTTMRRRCERLEKTQAICHCGDPLMSHGGDDHSPTEMPHECPFAQDLAAATARAAALQKDLDDIVEVWGQEVVDYLEARHQERSLKS